MKAMHRSGKITGDLRLRPIATYAHSFEGTERGGENSASQGLLPLGGWFLIRPTETPPACNPDVDNELLQEEENNNFARPESVTT